jgi:hypothetical protein
MRYYRWMQRMSPTAVDGPLEGVLSELELHGMEYWQLTSGQVVEYWDERNTAFSTGNREPDDMACTLFNLWIHVHSSRLRALLEDLRIADIQYLPLRVRQLGADRDLYGYHVANHLCLIDALDRDRSIYEEWGPERPDKSGQLRDVRRAVLSTKRVGDSRLFRLKGWHAMVIVREDVRNAIENAGMTGSVFKEMPTG